MKFIFKGAVVAIFCKELDETSGFVRFKKLVNCCHNSIVSIRNLSIKYWIVIFFKLNYYYSNPYTSFPHNTHKYIMVIDLKVLSVLISFLMNFILI